MTPARWQQVKDVLAAALEQSDAHERELFLARSCAGDTSLRREVISLLEQSADDVDECAESVAHSHRERLNTMHSGRRIGPYELVRELGRGGMGTVWLARRADEQFEKLVAIKLLKRGTDTDEVLRRFHDERRILARLDHPNIARLFDGGTTDDGLPYFVMEYVEGARLTDYCFAQNLSLGERIQLFRQICTAVQFAHQNLVVHRDLKPANILITTGGEPKLLDFGIAKLLAPGEETRNATIPGRERITPAYASPEQVRGEAVTTVSDVYTLGALLYEMLTGMQPYRSAGDELSTDRLAQLVCEQDPLRPSQVAMQAHLRRELRGDLDNIVLRAMAKLPARRYPSAGNLADDLRRYVEKKPVGARPDTLGYRTEKFLARNKTAAGIGVIAFMALIVGVSAIVWEARRADRRFEDVRHLANAFLFEFDDQIAALPGSTTVRRQIVERALQYLDGLVQESRRDRRLQLELAQAYLKVGDVQGRPYTSNLGDSAGALASYSKAVEIAKPLARAEGGSQTGARQILATAYENLGAVQARTEAVASAESNYATAAEIAQALLADDSAHADRWLRMLVRSRLGLGDAIMGGNHRNPETARYRAALAYYRQALPMAERLAASPSAGKPDARLLMQTCARIGGMLGEIGGATRDPADFQESFAFHERALRLDEEALRAAPESAPLRRTLADELAMAGYAHLLAGDDLKTALVMVRRALAIDRELASADASNMEAQQDLAHAKYVEGRIEHLLGNNAAARSDYREAFAILDPLTRAHPENQETSYDLARVKSGLEQVY